MSAVAVAAFTLAVAAGLRSLWSPSGLSVAETVCPSVRGAEGVQVAALLGGAGALTGGLVGLGAGAAWSGTGLGGLAAPVVAGVVAASLVLDLAAARRAGFRPPAVGRQVPVAWGRLFGARLAAALYGARLGVGPLTILHTWTWWAALLVGASLGPWTAAALGATFALVRTVTMVAAGAGVADGVAMQRRVAALVRAEAPVRAGTAALLVVVAAAVLLA